MSATPPRVNATAVQELYPARAFCCAADIRSPSASSWRNARASASRRRSTGVLIAARQHPGLSQSDAARLLGFDRATISQVVRGLEARGLPSRDNSHGNRRNKALQLTPKGAAALKRAAVAMERTSARLLSPFNGRERVVFVKLLARLANRLNGDSRTPVAGRERTTRARRLSRSSRRVP